MVDLDAKARALLALNRFGLGARLGDAAIVGADPLAWVLAVADGKGANQIPGIQSGSDRLLHIEALNKERRDLREADAAARRALPPGVEPPPQPQPTHRDEGLLFNDDLRARMSLMASSGDPIRERLAAFWSNFLAVSSMRGEVSALAVPYENEAIRPLIGGRFSDMLKASFRHPAMMLYLDAGQSVGPNSPAGKRSHRSYNENYARESMELHALGVSGGYTQDDIIQLALALTGWTVDRPSGAIVFKPEMHEPGPRFLLGRAVPDAGREQADLALDVIASHPSTSARICRRLAAHFVSDNPPPALVSAMDRAWHGSSGDLSAVYKALFSSSPAWDPRQGKFRDPIDLVVAGVRALGTGGDDAGAQAMLRHVRALGQPPFSAPSPQGYTDLESDWLTPDAVVQRINVAAALASGAATDPQRIARLMEEVIVMAQGSHTADVVARAPSTVEAAALILASPEFQRR